MLGEKLNANTVEGGAYRRDLSENIDTVAILINHSLDTCHLACNAVQTLLELLAGVRLILHHVSLYPIGVYFAIARNTSWGYTHSNLMFRKHTILTLVFALMATFLAPARFVFACELQRQSSSCPMMAAQQKTKSISCCAKSVTSQTASISATCCCNLQPAPPAPSFPEAVLVVESPVFILSTAVAPRVALVTRSILRATAALEVAAPRGPTLPFASLRAPPVLS